MPDPAIIPYTVQDARDAFAAIGAEPAVKLFAAKTLDGSFCCCVSVALACRATGSKPDRWYKGTGPLFVKLAKSLGIPGAAVRGIVLGWDSPDKHPDDPEIARWYDLYCRSPAFLAGHAYGAACRKEIAPDA